MTQTWALFVDSYRELNSKKLFWITMALSGLVVLAFAVVGINEKGLTVLWWEFPAPFNTRLISEATFYKTMFTTLGVGFWLGWLATILALISTAGMVPDFLAGGAIELTLSKPIGRLRLFLTKYAAALLFVMLQVAVFSVAAFLVIGFRGGTWEPRIFFAVPLVVLFYSYLYCVCTLIGLVTRSTIAALLFTMLFWFVLFGLNTTEQILAMNNLQSQMLVESGERIVAETRERVTKLESGDATTAPEPKPTEGGIGAMARWASRRAATEAAGGDTVKRLEDTRAELAKQEEKLKETRESAGSIGKAYRVFQIIDIAMPKLAETKELLDRSLITKSEFEEMIERNEGAPTPMGFSPDDFPVDPKEMTRRMAMLSRQASWQWIIGTSLGFQAVVLTIGAWIFCRRDF